MGPADLACAKCNCFPHLMVNLRQSGFGQPIDLNFQHPVQSRDQGPRLWAIATLPLLGFVLQFPLLENEKVDLDHGFLTIRHSC
jgi:hypothetical protein